MNEPKRYKHTFLYGTDGFVNESFLVDEKYNMADEGDYVLYSDYARLKAEVERLTSEVSYDNRVQLHVDKLAAEFTQSEVERLKAEVERLRKAGDELSNALAAFHLIHRGKIDTTTQPDIVAWNAAKEGKQP